MQIVDAGKLRLQLVEVVRDVEVLPLCDVVVALVFFVVAVFVITGEFSTD